MSKRVISPMRTHESNPSGGCGPSTPKGLYTAVIERRGRLTCWPRPHRPPGPDADRRAPKEKSMHAAAAHVTLEGTAMITVGVVAAIALAALVVAGFLAREVLAAPEGTARMREIAGAVQEGAAAYLNRQFRTLSVFAVLVFFLLFLLPADTTSRADRPLALLPRRRGLLGHDRLHRHVAGGARQRARRRGRAATAASSRRCGSPSAPAAWPACSPSASACFGAAIVVLVYKGEAPEGAGGLRLRRRTAGDVHARRRRHLHQGRRRRRRPGGQGRGAASPRTTRATRPPSPTTSATTSATAPAWPPTCSSPTP